MGYLNELLSRNPLVIDGGTIRPHHNYTDDLYTGGNHKITNYDRIKSMSVEEMAELFYGIIHERDLHIMKALEENGIEATLIEALPEIHIAYHKQWLEQEVSKDEETNG